MPNQLPQRVLGLRLQVSDGQRWLDDFAPISEATWYEIADRIVDISRTGTATINGVKYRWIP